MSYTKNDCADGKKRQVLTTKGTIKTPQTVDDFLELSTKLGPELIEALRLEGPTLWRLPDVPPKKKQPPPLQKPLIAHLITDLAVSYTFGTTQWAKAFAELYEGCSYERNVLEWLMEGIAADPELQALVETKLVELATKEYTS